MFVFGVSYVARVFHEALERIGRKRDVDLFVLNPCRELWSDVVSRGRGRERVITESVSGLRAPSETDLESGSERDDEQASHASSALESSLESPLLEAWGRPGREHVGTLDEAVDFDTVGRFVDPVRAPLSATHLQRVQRSLLDRAPVAPGPNDGSLVVVPCTSVRREVETVVSLVWGLLADADRLAQDGKGEPLRLNEIAILLPARDRETYLPHLEVVLEGAKGEGDDGERAALPWSERAGLAWSAQDLRLASRSRVAEAALRLLGFFGATPTRREVLGLVSHPLVRASAGEIEAPGERFFAELADEVGIVRGIDERDLRGTYADLASGEGRVLHFDQGLGRLALGCALGAGEETTPAATDVGDGSSDGHLGAAARVGTDTEPVVAFLTLVRSLLADHRALEGARLTLSAWASLFDALLGAYVRTSSGSSSEEKELDRCRLAVRGLAGLDVIDDEGVEGGATPRLYSTEIALGLATRALEDVPAVRGEPQSMGVVIASLLPMRAIPFRVVFVLGLGEGLFPEEGVELGLDLRRARRRVGDVAPEERDRYAFLETLVSTRERLFLSYVSRDEHTGDPHAPSSVLTELLEAAGGATCSRPPAQRHQALADRTWLDGLGLDAVAVSAIAAAMGGARGEHAVRSRGDRERHHFRDVEITTEAWARMSADDPRRVELALPALPPASLDVERIVRVDALRGFLACPLQGRARHWLRGLDDDRALLVDEEPLDTESKILGSLARSAFVMSLERGLGEAPRAALSRAVDEVVTDARGRGRVPVGVLGEDVRRAVTSRAERWLASLLEARPGVRHAHAMRLGSVSSDGAAGARRLDVRAALQLAIAPVPAGVSHAHREAAASPLVTVEGRTRAFLRTEVGAPPGDVVTILTGSAVGDGERAKLARGAAVIEAYVDHALLAASGQERLSRRVVLLAHDGAYEASLPGLAREQASRWLRGLADEIRAVEDPGWFFPVEAVLIEAESLRRGDPRLGEKLGKAIERVRTKLEGGSSRFGPLRDTTLRDAPEARDLVPIVARRHALPVAAVRPPVRAARASSEDLGLLR